MTTFAISCKQPSAAVHTARRRAQVESFLARACEEDADPLDTFVSVSDIIGEAARQCDNAQNGCDLDFLAAIQ